MAQVRKLSQSEVQTITDSGKSQRKLLEEQYDDMLRDFAPGDYGEVDLEDSESRLTTRNRMKRAADRRGIAIDFARIKGPIMRFQVHSPDSIAETAVAAAPTQNGRKTKEEGGKKRRKQVA